jgi:CubicO group peptidase (beta-lactamase class C family)
MHLPRFLSSALLAGFALTAQASPTLPGVGPAMQAMVDRQEVAGAVTLVTTKDKIVHLEATGFADIASAKPMQTDTLFWLASTTKPFTGVAILMLQDEGKLNVADPVAKYLPGFAKLKAPSGKLANITIGQLLTHTSGIGTLDRSAYATTPDLAGLIDGILAMPLQFEPGERWKYSSSSYDVAGRIVEIVSGKRFDVFLRERLFDPLAMKDTTFYPSEAQQKRLATCYLKSRQTGLLRVQSLPFDASVLKSLPPVPAGGLFSRAGDLARFCQMLLNRGVLDGKRYLSEASYHVLTTIQTGDLPNHALGWGLGVYVVRPPHGVLSDGLSAGTFGHEGAWGTHLIVDPVKGLAYVMLIQRSNLPNNFDNEPIRAFLQAAVGP